IYVNVAGGVRLTESSIDAALAAALYSARTDIAIKNQTVVFGELSLAGEIRPVTKAKNRIKAAQQLGFNDVVCPESEKVCVKVENIKQLVKAVFGK
ncbi:MAG: DNA repair protein RadA, partial [Treponema sp.]|nr:DNA repair protein RadA [Treponema sp.]